jgi:hypothetical protein
MVRRPERVIAFLSAYRQLYPVSRNALRHIAGQSQNWVKSAQKKLAPPILEAPQDGRTSANSAACLCTCRRYPGRAFDAGQVYITRHADAQNETSGHLVRRCSDEE